MNLPKVQKKWLRYPTETRAIMGHVFSRFVLYLTQGFRTNMCIAEGIDNFLTPEPMVEGPTSVTAKSNRRASAFECQERMALSLHLFRQWHWWQLHSNRYFHLGPH